MEYRGLCGPNRQDRWAIYESGMTSKAVDELTIDPDAQAKEEF